MGGAVAPIVKPVTKVVDKVVGTDLSGSKAKEQVAQANAQVAQVQAKVAEQAKAMETPSAVSATRSQEEMGSRIRGARRRGRQLLSDARLNPEAGIQTLGGGNNLG